MNHRAGIFTGQTVINCRNNLVNWLQQKKKLVKITNYQGTSYYSQRTQTEVVPIISHQWFVKTKLLAQKIINLQELPSKTIF